MKMGMLQAVILRSIILKNNVYFEWQYMLKGMLHGGQI